MTNYHNNSDGSKCNFFYWIQLCNLCFSNSLTNLFSKKNYNINQINKNETQPINRFKNNEDIRWKLFCITSKWFNMYRKIQYTKFIDNLNKIKKEYQVTDKNIDCDNNDYSGVFDYEYGDLLLEEYEVINKPSQYC